MNAAPVNEIATILAILVVGWMAERIIGQRRFLRGVMIVGVIAFVIVVAVGLASEVTP